MCGTSCKGFHRLRANPADSRSSCPLKSSGERCHQVVLSMYLRPRSAARLAPLGEGCHHRAHANPVERVESHVRLPHRMCLPCSFCTGRARKITCTGSMFTHRGCHPPKAPIPTRNHYSSSKGHRKYFARRRRTFRERIFGNSAAIFPTAAPSAPSCRCRGNATARGNSADSCDSRVATGR